MSSPKPFHVLAINNSPHILDVYTEVLADEGYRVSSQLHRAKDLVGIKELAPDLIILDYMWETEDSGWDMLQMLKLYPATTAIPIILCSGAVNRLEELAKQMRAMNVLPLPKPFDHKQLLALVHQALGQTARVAS